MLSGMKLRSALAVAAVAGGLILTACSSSPTPAADEMEPVAIETSTPTPEPTQEPAPEPGTRESPLAIGEQRKVGPDSMWSVGAEAASQVGAGYISLPLHIGVDWEAAKAQGVQSSDDVNPLFSLTISYVTAGGRSYDTADTYVDIPNQLYDVGNIYEPLADISTNYVVTLPDTEVEGGVWRVSNSVGDSVFIAAR